MMPFVRTRMVAIPGALVTLLAFGSAAMPQAADPEVKTPSPYGPTYDTCMDQSGGVTLAMLNCTADEQRRQDVRLNQAYQRVRDASRPERKQKLREAERAWIADRDASCSLLAEFQGGTMASLSVSGCFLHRTAERAKWLEELGDMAGEQ